MTSSVNFRNLRDKPEGPWVIHGLEGFPNTSNSLQTNALSTEAGTRPATILIDSIRRVSMPDLSVRVTLVLKLELVPGDWVSVK